MSVEFKNNSAAVLAAMETAKKKALTAIGQRAVEETVNYMQHRYGKNIYVSGDLQRDINSQPSQTKDAVDVGSPTEYAPFVHNGTARMPARPFLRDAVLENTDIWKEIAANHIGAEVK